MSFKASLLVTALLASASCFAVDTYQVSTSVYSQGKLVAAPIMVVEADKMASITATIEVGSQKLTLLVSKVGS